MSATQNHFSRMDASSRLKRASLARADHVICISQNTKRDLMELFGTPEEKISVIYHGFRPDEKNRPAQACW